MIYSKKLRHQPRKKMAIRFACINYADERGRLRIVKIEEVKESRSSKVHIIPRNNMDFDKENKYYTYWCSCKNNISRESKNCTNDKGACSFYASYIVKLAESRQELEINYYNTDEATVRAGKRLRLKNRPYSPDAETDSSESEPKTSKKRNIQKGSKEKQHSLILDTYEKMSFMQNRTGCDSSEDDCSIPEKATPSEKVDVCTECKCLKRQLRKKEEKIVELTQLNLTLQHILQGYVNGEQKKTVQRKLLFSEDNDENYVAERTVRNHTDDSKTVVPNHSAESNNNPAPRRLSPVDNTFAENHVMDEEEGSPRFPDNLQSNHSDAKDKLPYIKKYKPKLYRQFKTEDKKYDNVERCRNPHERYAILEDGKMIHLGLNHIVSKKSWDIIQNKKKEVFYRELALLLWSKKDLLNRCLDLKKIVYQAAPLKCLTPKKFDLYLGLIEDYIHSRKCYNELAEEQKTSLIIKSTISLTNLIRDIKVENRN